jgi:AraC-like DNA-binding protein
MGVVPVFHPDSNVCATLRPGLRSSGTRLISCRSVGRVDRVLQEELVDAVVVDVRHAPMDAVFEWIELYPRIPVFAYSAFRPQDGRLLAACSAGGFRGILVDGIDDAVAGEVVASRSAARERAALLADAPGRMRFTEPIQLQAWQEILSRVGSPTSTSDIARALGLAREHVSREFAAGGAPNLKRVIDLVRAACAAHLLTNPGYQVAAVARILGYASSSHLANCARRIAGVSAKGLADMGSRGVLNGFLRNRTRSRL